MELEELTRFIPKIEETIARSYAHERRRTLPTFRPSYRSLEEFALRGGKRLRALLLLAGYRLATGRSPRPAVSAAAALEHFQSWMLIHDDIIDHARVRRGGATLHRAMADTHRTSQLLGDSESYGMGLGITLGDLEEPFTIESILSVPVAAERRLAALAEYVRMARQTALGQVLDIMNGARPIGEVREEDVLLVHRMKTAAYTVTSPLRLGATLGGGRIALLQELNRFGVDIGVAFQLRDDILGAGFGTAEIGKSANDLVEGKRTLLVVRAWQEADEIGRATLEKVLGHRDAPPDAVEAARGVVRATGSLDYSEHRIDELSRRAFRRVDRSPQFTKDGRALLHEIGERLVHRPA